MKKIGIVGGVSWLSTVEYYSEIFRRCAPATPEISIESLDHNKAVAYLGREGDEESWARFDEYHRAALVRLKASGADFALIASNTPHDRLDSILNGVRIPVLSIFAEAAKECARIDASEVLILGTAVTMRSRGLRAAFAREKIDAVAPDETSRARTIELTEDLQSSRFDRAAERLTAIAQASGRRAVCLACTELPLALPRLKSQPSCRIDGVTYINSTVVHAIAAARFAMS